MFRSGYWRTTVIAGAGYIDKQQYSAATAAAR